jgi:valyl-tRNA synthetase
MLEARRIATRPLPVVRGLRFGDVAVAVAADALVRRAWALGRNTELVVPSVGGDLGTQFAFERELAKEGHDRSSVADDEYEVRAAAFAAERVAVAAEVFARLGVTVDVGAASTVADDAAAAARTAFVTLYEQGMVEQLDRVVATCPRCRTPVDGADVVEAEHEAELVTVRVETTGGDGEALEVVLAEVELLPGAVAVAVPEGHALAGAGAAAVVPIAGREVPIVADPLRATPGFVVPAHDAEGHAIAQATGLAPIQVLDDDGVVCVDGPLVNLGRYAARQAARDLLAAEGSIVGGVASVEQVGRCGCCGTVLVPQLGRHWFVRSGDLEVAAADAVRHGDLAFQPPAARDAFLATAGLRREWCVSSRVEGGVALPVAVCLDCGKLTVDATPSPSPSCGKCMGVLVGEGSSLDARFVAAAWALANAGWPRDRAPSADTVVVVGEDDLAGWVLPSFALGLRLTGALPFAGVVVHPWPGDADVSAREVEPFLDADPRVLRFALAAGTDDLDAAAAAVAALDSPTASASSDEAGDDAVAAGLAALDDGAPGLAATLLASALGAGVPAAAADRLRALVLPILGD